LFGEAVTLKNKCN